LSDDNINKSKVITDLSTHKINVIINNIIGDAFEKL